MAGIGWAPLGGEWWTWRWCIMLPLGGHCGCRKSEGLSCCDQCLRVLIPLAAGWGTARQHGSMRLMNSARSTHTIGLRVTLSP
jgi:hypothetical protein